MKLTLKMDLPKSRETVLDTFERLRKAYPEMGQFRRYKDEYALESPQSDLPHRWAAMRSNYLRAGTVNAATLPEAYALHHTLLTLAPSYLSISPLDVDYIELLYGFDLVAGGNHDAIVLSALLANSPLSALMDIPGATPIDFQPMLGMAMPRRGDTEVFFEVKTHHAATRAEGDNGPGAGITVEGITQGDPISVYVTLRKFGPILEVEELPRLFTALCQKGEDLVQHRVIPGLLLPIREAISSGNA